MQSKKREYFVRFYVKNPAGAYDPAHLPQFEIEGEDSPTIPLPGDVVFAWSKPAKDAEGSYSYFKVLERAFRFDTDEVFVFVLVQEVGEQWPGKFS